jgi:hypothetical protein
MWTGASQCIHDLLPARRVELHKGARVALKRWRMLLSTRRASEGLSMPWRFIAVSRPAVGCGATSQILVFPSGTNARLAASKLPQPLAGHRLPLVSRGERDTTGQSCGPC